MLVFARLVRSSSLKYCMSYTPNNKQSIEGSKDRATILKRDYKILLRRIMSEKENEEVKSPLVCFSKDFAARVE